MARWGKNDQAATANSTTTIESSNGAPTGIFALVKGAKTGTSAVSMDSNAHFGNTSAGSRASIDVNLFNNTSPSAFINNMATGVFGVSPTEMANNVLNSAPDMPAHAGWVFRRAGTGPVISATGTGGSGFANGESATVSNGGSNATLLITSNATGNISTVSVSIPGGGWTNTSMVAYNFNREKHLSGITVLNANSGYNNTDVIIASNGTVNAIATFVTNSTGGFVTANVTVSNVGLFPNTQTAGQVVLTMANSTYGSTTAGNSSVVAFTPTLANSSGGSLTITLGGRAGRVHTETLVAMGSLGVNTVTSTGVYGPANTNVDSGTDNSQYPGN